MIPLRLQLKNFLCYRDDLPPLELEGVQVACLCGNNGHGKSALLDAVTWALWGCARGLRFGVGSHPIEELVHQGQSEMEVTLEFRVGPTRYRALRKFTRGPQPQTVLDLQVSTGNGYRSLGESSVAATERRIQELLHMDYETFVKSAFLLQGRADRFTTSPPAERKRVLAGILGLSLYDQLQEQAREGSKRFGELATRIRAEVGFLEQELSHQREYEEALRAAQGKLDALAPQLGEAESQVEGLRQALRQLQDDQRRREETRQRTDQARQEVASLVGQVQAAQRRLQEYQQLLARRGEIQASLEEWQRASQQLEALDTAFARYHELDQQRLHLESRIDEERRTLETEARHLQQRIQADLEPQAARIPSLELGVAQTSQELEGLARREEALRQRREEALGFHSRVERLQSESEHLHAEMEELRQKGELLRKGDTRCPLCGTALGAEGLQHLEAELRASERDRQARLEQSQDALQRLRVQLRSLQEEVAQSEQALTRGRREAVARRASLEHALGSAREASQAMREAQTQLDALHRRLAQGEYVLEHRQTLAGTEKALRSLGYDPQQHQQARDRTKAMEPYIELGRRLQEAESALPAAQASLAALEELLQTRRRYVEEGQGVLAALEASLKELPILRSRLGALEAQLQELRAEHDKLRRQADLLENRLGELQEKASLREAREADLRSHEREQQTHDVLAEAFGQRGIQALLIDAALPELEAEANAILARLTDHRMSLRLETQRPTRRGTVEETLEVKVGDDLGTRSYELFSGGEAFRIDFALRVALAKFLASRAGAPLRTLFIDEGFGTQDAQGRERLVEAIQSIQHDFDLIIVITHIEELKDAFPVRIEVTKTAAGSRFQLVWT
ncbi:MAG: SMC family ATPase [Chloroflexi bacterium]|nr:SMC family ATPase [Chloroflexota bacterium]